MKQPKSVLKFINGGAIYIGKGVSTKMHRHHAIQLTISFKKSFEIASPYQTCKNCRFVIIPENVPHQFNCISEDSQVFIYLDPFSKLSQQLKNKFTLKSNIVVVDNLLNEIPSLKEWLVMENSEMEEVTKRLVEQITDYIIADSKIDIRITKSIEYLTDNLNKAIRIRDVATFVCLSESRYAHLFKLQVGIPFRRYILWLRLQKTLLSFLDENSFTVACYDGGFTDLPHFNRTFKEMFGNTPSAILKS